MGVLRAVSFLTLLAIAVAIGGCSTVGPGFANHPTDCAIGIAWADCLPGTAGYANGGGSVHRDAALKQRDAIKDQFTIAFEQCEYDYQSPDLDPIRRKVQFVRKLDEPTPFEFAANDSFPSPEELPVIAKWATIRDRCVSRGNAINFVPPDASPLTANSLRQEVSFYNQAAAGVGDLIVSLYQSKLTYGEFAKKRFEIGKAASDAQQQYRESRLINDEQRQRQAQQMADERYQKNMMAWSNYVQAVNARQPRTVNCVSNKFGSTVSTSCY
jgi:hypothetical protein